VKKSIVGCVLSFLAGCAVAAAASPGAYFDSVSDVLGSSGTFKNGYAAGMYDTVSLFAKAAASGNGISSQKTLALFQCLDSHGDKLGVLRSWADGVWGAGGTGSGVQSLVNRCL
jgi:hypothetical protein